MPLCHYNEYAGIGRSFGQRFSAPRMFKPNRCLTKRNSSLPFGRNRTEQAAREYRERLLREADGKAEP